MTFGKSPASTPNVSCPASRNGDECAHDGMCDHPPYVLQLTKRVPVERLIEMSEHIAKHPRTAPLIVDDDCLVVPIECSWCRKPSRRWWADR